MKQMKALGKGLRIHSSSGAIGHAARGPAGIAVPPINGISHNQGLLMSGTAADELAPM